MKIEKLKFEYLSDTDRETVIAQVKDESGKYLFYVSVRQKRATIHFNSFAAEVEFEFEEFQTLLSKIKDKLES